MYEKRIISKSADETYLLGKEIGEFIANKKSLTIGFSGDLGAGKTLMIKGIMTSLIPDEDVMSPTYTLMNQYEYKDVSIYHVDLYRIDNTSDLFGTGFFEALEDNNTIMFIEWIDKLDSNKLLEFTDLIKIDIKYQNKQEREICIKNLELFDKNEI